MSIPSDHKALLFIGLVAVLGATVRVARAVGGNTAQAVQPTLERQVQAADSALKAGNRKRVTNGPVRMRPGARRSAAGIRVDSAVAFATPSRKTSSVPAPLDRKGYIGRKLDLDVAIAAQIDSLPGVSTAMAKRIVADRMARGPFLNGSGLRRVTGVGPALLQRIDSLVTYSGSVVQPSPNDTVIVRPRRTPSARSKRPPVGIVPLALRGQALLLYARHPNLYARHQHRVRRE